jgi:hypothetical protein
MNSFVILFSVDAGDVGDCARTATLSVHVAIAASIVRILRDIRFSFPHSRKRFSIPCACVLRGRHLTLSRDIVQIVDQPRNSRVLDTCPSVSIDGMEALLLRTPKSLPWVIATRPTGRVRFASWPLVELAGIRRSSSPSGGSIPTWAGFYGDDDGPTCLWQGFEQNPGTTHGSAAFEPSVNLSYTAETLLRVPVPILVTPNRARLRRHVVPKKGIPAVEPPGALPEAILGGGEGPVSPFPLEERDFYEGYSVGISNLMKPDLRPCEAFKRKAIRTSASRRPLSPRPHCHGTESPS